LARPLAFGGLCVRPGAALWAVSIADEFLRRFKASLQRRQADNPLDPKTTLGPLSSEGALQDLLGRFSSFCRL
jgi:succinate-semialdehyde dehydrogenase/glutarate-semialdehyde dehydrogenase